MPTLLWILYLSSHCVLSVNALYDCPRAVCASCLPTEIHDAPGVGFDLTPSYGGSVVEIARVQGNPEYLEYMARLVSSPEPEDETKTLFKHIAQWLPISDVWSRKCGRWLYKLGYSAKDGIEIISDLLRELKDLTEREILCALDRVAVTIPDISSLEHQTINAALEDLGLRTWLGDSLYYPSRLIEADAVYVANGYGLCKNYQNIFECTDEFYDQLSYPAVLLVSFSRHLLYTAISTPINGEALARVTNDEAQVFDFEVGLDRLLQNDSQAQRDRLRQQLLVLPQESEFIVTHVLLAGESATNPQFLAVLKDALSELSPIMSPDLKMTIANSSKALNPTFAAARGAALYARRRQEVQADCQEPPECEIIRRQEQTRSSGKQDL
ncbi:uncharacterized protein N7498_000293 [Penicillium cinerascens]|uniref:Uncharacterized protein n=1 Tax=Penicillium cinerascens TaxID=70096 RepID=A0A9W9TD97_9EURO|nr:uncharacterized protein N7498_000293 [Penicillium cinerascens]KAJ5218194.1 hypothetical protein N7498_000293 [Penicillium cinerascens]